MSCTLRTSSVPVCAARQATRSAERSSSETPPRRRVSSSSLRRSVGSVVFAAATDEASRVSVDKARQSRLLCILQTWTEMAAGFDIEQDNAIVVPF